MTKKTTHTEEFIEEMKERLTQEKAILEQQLAKESHQEGGDTRANYPDYERDDETNAMESADFVAKYESVEKNEERLESVSEALKRIAQGTYGITKDGKLIPENRLRANPAATTLVT